MGDAQPQSGCDDPEKDAISSVFGRQLRDHLQTMVPLCSATDLHPIISDTGEERGADVTEGEDLGDLVEDVSSLSCRRHRASRCIEGVGATVMIAAPTQDDMESKRVHMANRL